MSDDEIEEALLENIRRGFVEVVSGEGEEPRYRLTDAGREEVQRMLGALP